MTTQVVNLTVGIYSQENSIENHNSILPAIYISIHGLCYDCVLSYPNVHYLSTMHLPQGQHAIYICSDIILFNLY